MELTSLAEHIFQQPPKPAGTIVLDFDDAQPKSDIHRMIIVSDSLMELLVIGVKILFNIESESLGTLTEEQIALLTQYFRSFRYSVIVKTAPIDQPPSVAKTHRRELKDFSERVYDFERGVWHEISFDTLRVFNR